MTKLNLEQKLSNSHDRTVTICIFNQKLSSSHFSINQTHTCTGPASEARMPSRVCPSVGMTPRGSRGLVSMELQSTWREAAPFCTLRATLCQRKSNTASTPSPVKTQLTESAAGSTPPARRDRVPSGPLKSTESWVFDQ